MKKEIFEKWTAALRSGSYEQGRLTLRSATVHRPEAFCCLGVLCEVMEIPRTGIGYLYKGLQYAGSLSPISVPGRVIPENFLVDEVGLRDLESTLMVANDQDNKTFTEIADMLDGFVATKQLILT